MSLKRTRREAAVLRHQVEDADSRAAELEASAFAASGWSPDAGQSIRASGVDQEDICRALILSMNSKRHPVSWETTEQEGELRAVVFDQLLINFISELSSAVMGCTDCEFTAFVPLWHVTNSRNGYGGHAGRQRRGRM